jgi:hypothetical protein
VCEPLCEGAMVAEGAIFQEVVLEPATEFPRIFFVGNSSSCIETGALEAHGCQVSPQRSPSGAFYLQIRRDRYSRHLGLLQLVTRVEYSCTVLHNSRVGFPGISLLGISVNRGKRGGRAGASLH